MFDRFVNVSIRCIPLAGAAMKVRNLIGAKFLSQIVVKNFLKQVMITKPPSLVIQLAGEEVGVF